MNVEDDYLDILQNIEFAIVQEYRKDSTLIDMDVLSAVEALLRYYRAEQKQHQPPSIEHARKPGTVFRAVKEVCEWRLGRPTQLMSAEGEADSHPDAVEVADILACLRRIQKSIRRWNKQGGRQGYLSFASQYQP